MDSTEIHYIDYDPDEIWGDMMTAYVEAGGDILYPGDEKEILLRSAQAIIVHMLAGVDNALRMQTLRYAVGDYLDLIGEMHGVERKPAEPSKFSVSIQENTTGRTTMLFAGTQLTYDGTITYHTLYDVILRGRGDSTIVAVESDIYGEQAILSTFDPLELVEPNPEISSVYVASSSSGGANAETDDSYRERIRTYGFSSVTAGPSLQYENIAKSVDDRIVDAKALNGGAGVVEVYLVINSGNISFIAPAVRDALSADNVRPLTDTVSVQGGEELTYDLTIQYTRSGAMVESDILKAQEEYVAWQNNHLGRPFNPDRLVAAIYQVGATRAVISEDSTFDDGEAVYTEIEEHQYCRGTITLEEIE